MLDENLPTFYIKPSSEKPKYQSIYYFCQGGEEPTPAYSVRRLDPALPGSKNRYAVAFYDAFCPDILYAEVLLIPKWTQPSLSQEAIRQNGGIPPPPEPILPSEFIIQLYNPEQQVLVRHKPKSWNAPASWDFEMPQQTFRRPSASAVDRTLNDPAASDVTPKLRFSWQKDGKFSKDLTCYLTGKTAFLDDARKRSKEPDITISIFKGLKEVTLYEPNFYRVEMEDFKGLEVVLLLGAAVIRDVYFGHLKTSFNITDPPTPSIIADSKPSSTAVPVNGASVQSNLAGRAQSSQQNPPLMPPRQTAKPVHAARPPPADPRSQWEIDAETKRLKQQAEIEARERRQKEKEAEKQTKKLLEAEEREKRRRQAQIDEETERLKKLYGKEDSKSRKKKSTVNPQNSARPPPSVLPPRPSQSNHQGHPSISISTPSWFSSSTRPQPPQPNPLVAGAPGLRPPAPRLKERRSIFGIRFGDNDKDYANVLSKKRSSMF
ncbi:predicted protein [Uncinocarpus reesii 1704]|uniref:Uncharacterized protein n=1 Tax=Uncinocarpus reesii (strain UAMH 1704) TaxID=336963 RepID=C4JG22_UNCRE|nr:uncharacterized protein UREG_01102 [Uncinocarpus reesii 1704]EEP76253.1 predicted protein [Uncinocarpus reesii 1704]